ncbi:alkaline phosphatase family protein [Gemmatimonadota bacterium]
MTLARVLLIFLDGIGIGPADPDRNPFLRASLPTLRGLLGGRIPTHRDPTLGTDHAWAGPTDALLGVEGLPQSGTGQAALLTGKNAPALFGRHFGPWVPVSLRPLVMKESLLARARAGGISCAFANAYPREFHRLSWARRPAGPPLAAHGAGLLTRDEDELAVGLALSSEITNAAWRTHLGFTHLPDITPEGAGQNLARIATPATLTFFAHFSTDTAGHKREMEPAIQALEKVDRFLGAVLTGLPPDSLLVVSSDHGNLEDITQSHTLNPVLTLLAGPGANDLARGLTEITDVPGLILGLLSE